MNKASTLTGTESPRRGDVQAGSLSASPDRDVLLAVARGFWYLGCVATPASAVRISGIAICDLLFLASTALALLSSTRFRCEARPTAWTIGAFLVVVSYALAKPALGLESAGLVVAVRGVLLWTAWRWTCSASLGRPVHLWRAVYAYLLGCAISGAVAFGQFALGATILGLGVDAVGARGARAPGLSVHVNEQGGALAVGLCMGLALWAHRREPDRREAGILALVLITGTGIVLSGSITGMIAALCGSIYLAVLGGQLRKVLRLSASIGASLYVLAYVHGSIVATSPLTHFRTATSGDGRVNTLRARLETMSVAWENIQLNPWNGVGLDPISGVTYNGLSMTHNVFLLYWFQGGFVLLVALVVVLASVTKSLFRVVSGEPAIRQALAAGFITALVYGLTAPIMFQRFFWLPAVLAIALASASKRQAGCGENADSSTTVKAARRVIVSSAEIRSDERTVTVAEGTEGGDGGNERATDRV